MVGQAVAERAIVSTGDYMADPAFTHAPETDGVSRDIGIRSMVVAPLVAGDEVFGAMGTFSSRPDAFDPAQIALVRSLADHAAGAMANARLIEALDVSRKELAERAEVERALREIGARISAATDLPAVLQLGVDEAARLLHADGARIDLIDPVSGLLRWAYASGALHPDNSVWPEDPDETLDQGISGQAVVTGQVYRTGDYAADPRFPHGVGADTYVEATGIRSVMSAPLIAERGPFGTLTVFTGTFDAWTDSDAGLLAIIADQAAIALTNARLVDQLATSRGELARTAEAERTLRRIAAEVSAMRDQDEILQSVIDASVALLGATGAMIDLLGGTGMAEAWTSQEAGRRAVSNRELLSEVTLSPDAGVSGRAVQTRHVEWSGSYLDDDRFVHTTARDAFVRESGSTRSSPRRLIHREVVVGAITVYSTRPDAFDATRGGAPARARRPGRRRHRQRRPDPRARAVPREVARRADAERTLREIAARVSAILDPAEVLQQIVEETTPPPRIGRRPDRPLRPGDRRPALVVRGGRGDGRRPRMGHDRAASSPARPSPAPPTRNSARCGRTTTSTDDRFERDNAARAFVTDAGLRSVDRGPTGGRRRSLGHALGRVTQAGAYDEADSDVLTALATQAAIAIRNARLIEELARSARVIARRAEAEQALREIAARITAIREPGDLLQHVVDEAQRLLRADGAVIDQFNPVDPAAGVGVRCGSARPPADAVRQSSLLIGEGLAGTAVALTAGDDRGRLPDGRLPARRVRRCRCRRRPGSAT